MAADTLREMAVVLTIAVEFPDGGMSTRSWPIERATADAIASQLGEPLVEAVLNEDEMQASNRLVDATELPAVWSGDRD